MAAGTESVAGRVHGGRASRAHPIAAHHTDKVRRNRNQLVTINRLELQNLPPQSQLGHRVVARYTGKAVVARIGAGQPTDRFDRGIAPRHEVAAGANVARRVHHNARHHRIAAHKIGEAHRARRQRCAIDRAAQANAAGQCALVDNIIAAICCNKFVVDRIRADQPADRLDARIAARGKVAAGAGVAGGIDRNNARRHAVTRHQIGAETHRTRCERIAIR